MARKDRVFFDEGSAKEIQLNRRENLRYFLLFVILTIIAQLQAHSTKYKNMYDNFCVFNY